MKLNLLEYLSEDDKIQRPINPLYDLKGAARVALEYYRPPDFKDQVEPVDIFDLYSGRISEHTEGMKYLEAMKDLGGVLHNGNKTKEAIQVFEEMISLDSSDPCVRILLFIHWY